MQNIASADHANLIKQEMFGTLEAYTESFYYHFQETHGIDLISESATLNPLIEQAHNNDISTMYLVEIVKGSMK